MPTRITKRLRYVRASFRSRLSLSLHQNPTASSFSPSLGYRQDPISPRAQTDVPNRPGPSLSPQLLTLASHGDRLAHAAAVEGGGDEFAAAAAATRRLVLEAIEELRSSQTSGVNSARLAHSLALLEGAGAVTDFEGAVVLTDGRASPALKLNE